MTPTDRAVLARPSAVILRAGAAARAARALMGGASDRLLDRDHASVVEVEPDLVHLAPASEQLVTDVEGRAGVVLLAPRGEVGRLEHRLRDRAIAVLGEDPLLLGGVRVLDERLGGGGGALRRHHRQLDQHRRLRNDELPLLPGGEGGVRLAFVGDEDVALAGEEGVRRGRAGRGLRDDVLEELRDPRDGLLVAHARLPGLAVCGEHVPLRRSGGERIRRHDLNARLDEVLPGVDVLRIARPDDEGDETPLLFDMARVSAERAEEQTKSDDEKTVLEEDAARYSGAYFR